MWNQAVWALALSVTTFGCSQGEAQGEECNTVLGSLLSAQGAGNGEIAFDPSARAAAPQVSSVEQGTLAVSAFELHDGSNGVAVLTFHLGDASVLVCTMVAATLTTTGAVSDVCSNASLLLESTDQQTAVQADLTSASGTLSSSVTTDSNGNQTVSVTVDLTSTGSVTWFTGVITQGNAEIDAQHPHVGGLDLGGTHLVGTETMTSSTTQCHSVSNSPSFGGG